MNASDFRIGNLVDLYGTIATIQAIDFSTGFAIAKGNPIVLNEKWLLKAKLTHTIQNTFLMGGFELIYDSPNERYNVHTFRGIICVVRYVHQLQNLYFCLSGGEELVFSTEP